MVNIPSFIFIDDSTVVRTNVPNVIRSEMASGPVKQRPINSVPMYNLSFEVSVNKAKFTNYRSWFINDLLRGTLWFTMKEPITGQLVKVRFADTELEWRKAGNLMRSSFVLEAYDAL